MNYKSNHFRRWKVADPLPVDVDRHLQGYPPVLRQILFNRGYRSHAEARQYLEAQMPPGTEPENMLGILPAAERIQWAINHDEKVAIYGDYDADGVTATALLSLVLQSLGANVIGYIPNRFDEGYGLNNTALDTLRESGTRLVITVDCGIRSIDESEHAQKIGLDLIISDHHHPSPDLPPAVAVINPKQPGDPYPQKDLAGVGLAYKLAASLLGSDNPLTARYLDLVALGTVADLAPLIGENRALVRTGLDYIRLPHRQGVISLKSAAGITTSNISATHIGFMLGPRLNAAGRLDTALAALELLTSQNPERTGLLAQQLDDQNRERQRITQEIQAQAESQVDRHAMLLFTADPSFNPGVVGLAASRLTERFYRPAIVAHQGEQVTRGSCRSIPEFHITQALDQCSEILIHHGGHAAAAGFTVSNENLPELVDRLQCIATQQLSSLDLRRTLQADLEIPLSELKPEILDYLKWLEPIGQQNPQAVFVSRDLRIKSSRRVGRDEAHLKLDVTDGRITYSAIAFQQGQRQDELTNQVDLLYNYELNEFNGRTSLQLNVIDIKPAGTPDD